jgi:predicted ATPase/DNA-binding winged helix-turn-helix (wHTH) protein
MTHPASGNRQRRKLGRSAIDEWPAGAHALLRLRTHSCVRWGSHLETGRSFGHIEVLEQQRKLLLNGKPVRVGARAFDTLQALVTRRDRIVMKSELMDAVWPDQAVEENNLVVQIGALRKLLGTEVIATIPGRGYRFVAPTEGAPATVPRARAALAANEDGLPALIGREHDIAALDQLAHRHRLITVTGAGGIGKTRLARQLMRSWQTMHEQGATWVELEAVADASQLTTFVASALAVDIGRGEPLDGLLAALKPLRLLLVLDNAEHVADGVAGLVQAVLDGAPGVCLLVTSQVPLALGSEQVVRLDPLAVPVESVPPAQALSFGAVALFVARAQQADRRFELTADNVSTVIEICRRLDGLALAIEFAAARVRLLGLKRLHEALDQRLRLLASPLRHAPPRQQTLRAALEWSHGLLEGRDQIILRRLAVFVGTFSLEMVQTVVTDDALDRWAVLDGLGTLVDRSMVVAEGGDMPRYRLLESTRAFALERLAAAGEGHAWRERHARALAEHFRQVFADRFTARLGVDEAREMLTLDLDNARDAMAWALASNSMLAVLLAPALSFVLRNSGHVEQRKLWEASAAIERTDMPIEDRASWALHAAMFGYRFRESDAVAHAREALSLYRQIADRNGEYLTLYIFCVCPHAVSATERAEALQQMRLLESADTPPQIAYYGAWATAVSERLGTPDAALIAFERALILARASGNSIAAEHSLIGIADVSLAAGRVDAAIQYGRELLAHLERTRNRNTLAIALVNLVGALLEKEATTEAHRIAVRGWPLGMQFGLQPYWGDYVALLAALEQRFAEAATLLGYANAAYALTQRQANEARAADRAERLARQALGDDRFVELHAQGATLDDVGAAVFAFGPGAAALL